MAFPFEALDLLLPHIASAMAGKSLSEKQRLLRAGVGLVFLGSCLTITSILFPSTTQWAFGTLGLGYFMSFLCFATGLILLIALLIDKIINKTGKQG
jgi:hypothetical protein